MNIEDAIKKRRSIRRFKDTPVSKDTIRKIIEAATFAPSGHNVQPWRFTVLTGQEKDRITQVMEETIHEKAESHGAPLLGSSFNSCNIMKQAPVLILVWSTCETFTAPNQVEMERRLELVMPDAKRLGLMVGIQGVSAAIQNMLLTAFSLGLGSLWVNDLYYAIDAISCSFDNDWRLVAGVSIGHPVKSEMCKGAPSKLSVDEVTEFR